MTHMKRHFFVAYLSHNKQAEWPGVTLVITLTLHLNLHFGYFNILFVRKPTYTYAH